MKLGTNTENDDVLSPDRATLFKENRNVSGCVFGSGHFWKESSRICVVLRCRQYKSHPTASTNKSTTDSFTDSAKCKSTTPRKD